MMLGLAGGGVDARADIAPRAIVERLLLAPEQAGVGVLVEMRRDKVVGEGRDLLDAADRDVLDAAFLTGLEECKIDLTWKQEQVNVSMCKRANGQRETNQCKECGA